MVGLLLGASGDGGTQRVLWAMVALLLVVAAGVAAVAVWAVRTSRPERTLLAPLEAMGDRSWRRRDPMWQRRRLDALRPRGARPMTPVAAPPTLDKAFDEGPSGAGFDDLRTAAGTEGGSSQSGWAASVDTPPMGIPKVAVGPAMSSSETTTDAVMPGDELFAEVASEPPSAMSPPLEATADVSSVDQAWSQPPGGVPAEDPFSQPPTEPPREPPGSDPFSQPPTEPPREPPGSDPFSQPPTEPPRERPRSE